MFYLSFVPVTLSPKYATYEQTRLPASDKAQCVVAFDTEIVDNDSYSTNKIVKFE